MHRARPSSALEPGTLHRREHHALGRRRGRDVELAHAATRKSDAASRERAFSNAGQRRDSMPQAANAARGSRARRAPRRERPAPGPQEVQPPVAVVIGQRAERLRAQRNPLVQPVGPIGIERHGEISRRRTYRRSRSPRPTARRRPAPRRVRRRRRTRAPARRRWARSVGRLHGSSSAGHDLHCEGYQRATTTREPTQGTVACAAEHRGHLGARHRTRPQPALAPAAPNACRISACRGVSTPSATTSSPMPRGQTDDRAHDLAVDRRGVETGHERPVDLERVDRRSFSRASELNPVPKSSTAISTPIARTSAEGGGGGLRVEHERSFVISMQRCSGVRRHRRRPLLIWPGSSADCSWAAATFTRTRV